MKNTPQHSESWHQTLVENLPDAVLVFDEKSRRFEAVNGSAERLFGHGRETFLAMTVPDISAGAEATLTGDELRRHPEVQLFKTSGGTVFMGEVSEGKFMLDGRSKIAWTVRDVTERTRREAKNLKREERRYQSLVDNIAIGVTLIRPDMRILTLNKQMKHWYPDTDFSGRPLCYECFNDPPGEGVCSYCPVIKTLRDGQVHESITETPSGGTIRYFRIISSPVMDDDGKVQAAIEMVEDITEYRKATRRIKNLSQQLLSAQENERLMISNELHDSVAQELSTMKISLELLTREPRVLPEDAHRTLADMSALLNRSILTVRNLSYNLRPPGLKEIGLLETLSFYCEEFEEDAGIRVKFRAAGLKGKPMDPFMEINIYRLVQEGLNNIRKHADAGQATIRLVGSYPNIILRIEDDGRGFDVDAPEHLRFTEKHMGLNSMKERVHLLLGRMTIQSRPGEGTRIFIKFPFGENI